MFKTARSVVVLALSALSFTRSLHLLQMDTRKTVVVEIGLVRLSHDKWRCVLV